MPETKPKEEPIICSICQMPIEEKGGWAHGNNAQPVNAGRCCDECNDMVVIPARINRMVRQPRAG